jgi:fatty acyl-CoA reductase
MFQQNVNVIINCAASVNFDDRLDVAILNNINGAMELLKIAKETKNLDVYHHISTAYVNCLTE